MTVQELIDELQHFDPNMEVKFGYGFGDHRNTMVAANITEIDTERVTHSDYHRMDKVTEGNDNVRVVVLLQ